MATDPPASDLGALRARRLALTADMLERQGKHVMATDIRAVLAAIDAQAARLAAVEAERNQQTALVCQWDERDHAKTVRIAELERERDQARQRATRLATLEEAARAWYHEAWDTWRPGDGHAAEEALMHAVANLAAPTGETPPEQPPAPCKLCGVVGNDHIAGKHLRAWLGP